MKNWNITLKQNEVVSSEHLARNIRYERKCAIKENKKKIWCEDKKLINKEINVSIER